MKNRIKMTEVICLPRNPSQFAAGMRQYTAPDRDVYLGVVVMNDGRPNKEIDTWIDKL